MKEVSKQGYLETEIKQIKSSNMQSEVTILIYVGLSIKHRSRKTDQFKGHMNHNYQENIPIPLRGKSLAKPGILGKFFFVLHVERHELRYNFLERMLIWLLLSVFNFT